MCYYNRCKPEAHVHLNVYIGEIIIFNHFIHAKRCLGKTVKILLIKEFIYSFIAKLSGYL